MRRLRAAFFRLADAKKGAAFGSEDAGSHGHAAGGGVAVVNLRTSSRIGPEVEPYSVACSLFDTRYASFGTPHDLGAAEALGPGLPKPRAVFNGARVAF